MNNLVIISPLHEQRDKTGFQFWEIYNNFDFYYS